MTGHPPSPRLPEERPGNLWPTPEQRLLLHAATGDPDRAVEAFRVWRKGIDLKDDFGWAALRLLPLVFHNLRELGLDEPMMGRLKGVYRRAWVENHQLFNRVSPALEALVAEGLDILLLKGAPLVTGYYGNPALRPMSDLDVVVPFSQVKEAIRCMSDMGWSFFRHPDPDMLKFHHAVQCFGPGGGELDLHWHVTYEACTEYADDLFWSRSEPFEFLGLNVRQLDPTALLLHTVIHGVRWNPETPIRWIPDALMVLRQRGNEIEWDRMQALALEIESPVRARMGMEYLREEFGADIPLEFVESLPAKPVSLRERIDNAVILRNPSFFERSAVRWQVALFAEYCRRYWARSPVDFLYGFSHFLRFRWGLRGRREIIPIIMNGLWRRIMGRPAPVPSAPVQMEQGGQ